MFQDKAYGSKVDMFSVGIIFVELMGLTWGREKVEHAEGWAQTLLRNLPPLEATSPLRQLPKFPRVASVSQWTGWPDEAYVKHGSIGVDFAEGLLQWSPVSRLSSAEASQHAFLAPERFVPGGVMPKDASRCYVASPERLGPWQGHRHPWAMLVGVMGSEVLQWLRADMSDFGFDFESADGRKDIQLQCAPGGVKKFTLAGTMGGSCTSSMNGLALKADLPLPRLLAWFKAWQSLNAAALGELTASARQAVRQLKRATRAKTSSARMACNS